MTRKKSPLGVLFLTLFLDLVGFSIIFPLFPEMLDHYIGTEEPGGLLETLTSFFKDLAGGEGDQKHIFTAVLFGGFLGSLYSILQFLFSPIWGGLSDRFGRKRILLITISGLGLSYLLWTFSGSFALLVFSRLLGGCMSGNIATVSAAIADCTSREHRAKGMAVIGAAFGLGFILGPAIGGLSFWLIGGANSTINLLQSYPALADYGFNPFSAPAAIAFLLSMLNLLWVVSRFDETLTPELRAQARQHRRPLHPMMLLGKVNIPSVSRANLANFLFLVSFAGAEFTLSFFAYEAFAYRTGNITMLFIFAGLVIALVQGGVVRRVAPKYGERNVVIAGFLFLIPGYLLICFSPPSQVMLYAGLAFISIGSALTTSCLTALVSLYTPDDRQGAILGIYRSVGALSRAVGPIIFCGIYWKLGRELPFVAGAILLLVPTIMCFKLPQPEKSSE